MQAAPLNILYFAWLREKTGCSAETLAMPDGVATLGDLMAWLRARDDRHRAAFANPRLVRAAVNQVFAAPDTMLAPGDEVAFFPPVTGG
jgi:molybdopterin synthase sulfur carrier subunit